MSSVGPSTPTPQTDIVHPSHDPDHGEVVAYECSEVAGAILENVQVSAADPLIISQKDVINVTRSSETSSMISSTITKIKNFWNTLCIYAKALFTNVVSQEDIANEEKKGPLSDTEKAAVKVFKSSVKMMSNIGMLGMKDYLGNINNSRLDVSLITPDSVASARNTPLENERPFFAIQKKLKDIPEDQRRGKVYVLPFVFPPKNCFSVPHIVSIFVEYPLQAGGKPTIIYYDPQGKKMDDPSRLEVFSDFNLKEDVMKLAGDLNADVIEPQLRNQTDWINCGIHASYMYKQIAQNSDKSVLQNILDFNPKERSVNEVRAELYRDFCSARSPGISSESSATTVYKPLKEDGDDF